MAALIGNMFLILLAYVVFQKLFGSLRTNTIRDTLESAKQAIDQQDQRRDKIKKPDNYCNSAELLLISSMLSHPANESIREQFQLTEAQTKKLSRKLLREIGNR